MRLIQVRRGETPETSLVSGWVRMHTSPGHENGPQAELAGRTSAAIVAATGLVLCAPMVTTRGLVDDPPGRATTGHSRDTNSTRAADPRPGPVAAGPGQPRPAAPGRTDQSDHPCHPHRRLPPQRPAAPFEGRVRLHRGLTPGRAALLGPVPQNLFSGNAEGPRRGTRSRRQAAAA